MYATFHLLEKHSYLMTCRAYVLTGVGLDLMRLLGWVSLHDAHHYRGILRIFFCSWYFGVWILGLLQAEFCMCMFIGMSVHICM
jgi:hypothetical protein